MRSLATPCIGLRYLPNRGLLLPRDLIYLDLHECRLLFQANVEFLKNQNDQCCKNAFSVRKENTVIFLSMLCAMLSLYRLGAHTINLKLVVVAVVLVI
jgi:hypothetical protein